MKFKFEDYYTSALKSDEFKKFVEILNEKPRKCLRVNTLKISVAEFKKLAKKYDLKLMEIPWSKSGFWYEYEGAEQNWKIGNTELYQKALVYPQDAASLLPVEALEPKEDEMVLDLAAAPGGKTTFIAQKMNNTGLIIANEVVASRSKTLQNMLAQFGVLNTAVTGYDPSFFVKFYPNFFDKVLLDAPCSGEGMRTIGADHMRKFSINKIKFNAKRQVRLIKAAFNTLKPGGTMVYSTCAMAIEENEAVVSAILKEFKGNIEIEPIKNIEAPGLKSFKDKIFDPNLENTARVWPHIYNTNGFYVAAFKKKTNSPLAPQKMYTLPEKSFNWKVLHKKAALQIVNLVNKQLPIKEKLNLNVYNLVEHFEELWLHPKKLKQIENMKINYAGIKIGTHYKKEEINLSLPFRNLY